MISWLAVNSAFVLLLLTFLGTAIVVGWWINRKSWYLFALAPVAVVTLAVALVGTFYVTDQRRLVRTIEEMAQAIERKDVNRFFTHVSASFNHAAMGKDAFRMYVQSRIERHRVTRFSVSKFDFGEVSRAQKKAEVDFWIHTEGNWEGGTLPLRCVSEFVLEDENWRLKGFRLMVGNTAAEFHLPSGR